MTASLPELNLAAAHIAARMRAAAKHKQKSPNTQICTACLAIGIQAHAIPNGGSGARRPSGE